MRRLSPNDIKKNVAGLATLIQNEDLRYEVIQKIDQPLGTFLFVMPVEMEIDEEAGREFLKCEYNRDGDAYRSPWTNKYYPLSGEDHVYPSAELRALEVKANEVFQRYAGMYFDQGFFSSVYFFDTDSGFGGAFLVKKQGDETKQVKEGIWDSIHIVQVAVEEKKAKYRVVSTVFLKMLAQSPSYGELEIAGNISRTKED
jgi:capping protein beta